MGGGRREEGGGKYFLRLGPMARHAIREEKRRERGGKGTRRKEPRNSEGGRARTVLAVSTPTLGARYARTWKAFLRDRAATGVSIELGRAERERSVNTNDVV